MVEIQEIYNFLNEMAPVETAEEWDNVGLLAGGPEQQVRRVMVALDITREVIDEAVAAGCGLIVSHHPLILKPLSRVLRQGEGEKVHRLIKNSLSAICMHTNLDAADGGVNDALAGLLGLENVGKLPGNELLRAGELPEMPLADFLEEIKKRLGCQGLKYSGHLPVRRVAVGGGSCGDMFREAVLAGCDTFVTGEVRYHDFLEAGEAGLNIIEAGHFATERPVVFWLARKLREKFGRLEVLVSEKDRDIIKFF
jgi:dinuclear metal center YbgI/SA1388 family protein